MSQMGHTQPLANQSVKGRFWPKAPVDAPGLNDRCRGIAAVGSATRNGCKGSIAPTHDSQRGDRFRVADGSIRADRVRQV